MDLVDIGNGNEALIMEKLSDDMFLVSVKYKRDDCEWWPGDNLEIIHLNEIKTKKVLKQKYVGVDIRNGKTLVQLWEENNKKSKLFVMSPTNKTPKYEVLLISTSKGLAILTNRPKGFYYYFKKYYQLFSLNNPRWFKV